MKPTAQFGFTLWELLVTLLVAGVLLGLGIPNFMEFQRSSAMASATNQMITGVMLARAEAVKRQVPVMLCMSPNPTDANPTCSLTGTTPGVNGGFIVWVDENGNFNPDGSPNLADGTDGNGVVNAGEQILMQSEGYDPAGPLKVWQNAGYIAFTPNGWTRQIPGFPLSMTFQLLCDDRNNRFAAGQLSAARGIRIEITGRAEALMERAQVSIVLGTLNGSMYGAAATCPLA